MTGNVATFNDSKSFVLWRIGEDNQEVTAETIGTGNGVATSFAFRLAKRGIEPGSLVITVVDSAVTATDQGDGTLTGSGIAAGSVIDYEAGTGTVVYSVAPADTKAVRAAYWALEVLGGDFVAVEEPDVKPDSNWISQAPATGELAGAPSIAGDFWATLQLQMPLAPPGELHTQTRTGVTVATGDGSTKTHTFSHPNKPFVRGRLKITDGTETFVDNGDNTLTGSAGGSGTYDERSGKITITTNAATGDGVDIKVIELAAEHDGAATSFSFTCDHPGIVAGSFSASDGTETWTDDSDGTLTGSEGGDGTINYATGAVVLNANAAAANGTDIDVGYQYLPLPDADPMMRSGGYKRYWEETSAHYRHYYDLDACGHEEAGVRYIRKATDCTTGMDHRLSRVRIAPSIKGGVQQRLMMESGSSFGNMRTKPLKLPALPTKGPLPDELPVVHSRAAIVLKHYGSSTQTWTGRLGGDIEIGSPYSPTRQDTAYGDEQGGTAEVALVSGRDSHPTINLSVQLDHPDNFDVYGGMIEGNFYSVQLDWKNRRYTARRVRYEAVFQAKAETSERNDAVMAELKGMVTHGLPSDTPSTFGTDLTKPLGRLSFMLMKS